MPKANGTTELANKLGVSRQRAWSILRYRENRCGICGLPRCQESRMYCETHRQMMNAQSLSYYHIKAGKKVLNLVRESQR
jgi:hypothetical protein